MDEGPLRTERVPGAPRPRWRIVDAEGRGVGYAVELRGGYAWVSPDERSDGPDTLLWRSRPYETVAEALADVEWALGTVGRRDENDDR